MPDLQNKGIQTVAFIHGDVSPHSVLPALACSQIVMSKEPASSLGKVAEPGKPLDATERLAYELIAANRFPLALVHKMHDANMVVIKVRPTVKSGDRYRDANEKPRVEAEPVADLGRGVTAAYNFDQAREYNLCQRNRTTTSIRCCWPTTCRGLRPGPVSRPAHRLAHDPVRTGQRGNAQEDQTAHQAGSGAEGQRPDPDA